MQKTANPKISNRSLAWLLAVVYCVSYITRINLSAVIQEVATRTEFEKSALSIILVCLSISYGLGQIVNGRIGDIIKPQNLIFIGLCTATVANFIFPFCSASLPAMCVIWTVNGFAQAMMWPPMVKIMVCTMNETEYGRSVVTVSVGSSVGTILVYLIAPLIIATLSWKFVLFFAAAIGLGAVVLWGALKRSIHLEPITDGTAISQDKGFKFPKIAIYPIIFISLGIIFQGMLRDGVTSWMPTYLAENFKIGNDISILCTVSLAIFSLLIFVIVGAFYKKFFKNEVACAALIFSIAVLASLVLLVCFNMSAILTIVCMMTITGAMHGVNMLLVSYVPKRFRKYGNISTMSGFINSFTYVGAAIATYGIAKLSELYGWRITVAIWACVAAFGTACLVLVFNKWKRFIEK